MLEPERGGVQEKPLLLEARITSVTVTEVVDDGMADGR